MPNENEDIGFWGWLAAGVAGLVAILVGANNNWWGLFDEDPKDKKDKKVDKDGKEVVEKGTSDPQEKNSPQPSAEVKDNVVTPPEASYDTVVMDVGKKNGNVYQRIHINSDGKFLEKPSKDDKGNYIITEAGTLVVEGLVKNLSDKEAVFEVWSFARVNENGEITEKYHSFPDANKRPSFKIEDKPTSNGIIGEVLYGKIHSASEDNKKVIEYLRNNWENKTTDKDLSSLVDQTKYPNIPAAEVEKATANKTPIVSKPDNVSSFQSMD
jgi:hypothetical protein